MVALWINTASYAQLQELWWLLCSVIGSLFLFLTFVQGGQTLLRQVAKTENEKSLLLNSLGRKWELTFTDSHPDRAGFHGYIFLLTETVHVQYKT